jgi:hypothetical protein
MRRQLADAQQALGFLIEQTSHIESEVVRILYPDIQYPQLIPVDTSAFEWAKSVTFFSMDKVGQAGWFHHMAKDIPIADVQRTKHEHGIEMAGIGYRYTLEEIGQAMMIPGLNLSTERAEAARRAYEEFVDYSALYGDEDKEWTGLINDASVTAVTAIGDGTGNSGAWADKDADKILRDVNDALSGIYTESRTVEMADTVGLPVAEHTRLATKRIPDTTMTVLQFLMLHNVYTAQTGQPLMVRAIRGLETAGEGGTGRMIAYRRDPRVLKLHLPMPHRFLPIWQTGPITYDIPGIFRLGGVEIRRPGAMRYVDGIIEGETG